MRNLLLTIAVASVTALPVAGCGSEDQAASGASELVPAGVAVYGETTLEPEGDQKEAIDTILSKFPGGGEAGDKLKDLIDKGLRQSDPDVSFKDDIEPWLGDEAAFFGSHVGGGGDVEATAALIATDDEDAALETLEKTAEGKITRKTYRDVEYIQDESSESNTAAVFDGFLVFGSELGVKAAIDAGKGDSKLSDDEDYKKAIDGASDDRLGLFYVNTPEFLKAAQGSTGGLPDSFKKFFQEPFVATADADKDGVIFEATLPEELGQAFGFLGQASDLLPDMPADSWLALGQTDFGKLLGIYVDAFAAGAGGRDAIEQQVRSATGLDLQKDVIGWMGDFGIFVRGKSLSELDGALVIETSDEAASGRFIEALARLARSQTDNSGDSVEPLRAPGGGKGYTLTSRSFPKPIHLFQQDGKVVLAYGDAAAADAVDPSQKLGDSPEFSANRDSLGGDYDVSAYLLMQPILDLVEAAGSATDADWQKAKPYLEPLDAIVGGTSGDGDDLRSAMKLIVK
jgi:hypothetical protein